MMILKIVAMFALGGFGALSMDDARNTNFWAKARTKMITAALCFLAAGAILKSLF